MRNAECIKFYFLLNEATSIAKLKFVKLLLLLTEWMMRIFMVVLSYKYGKFSFWPFLEAHQTWSLHQKKSCYTSGNWWKVKYAEIFLVKKQGRGYGAGARPGLQIRCRRAWVRWGEFDSHALPPIFYLYFKYLHIFLTQKLSLQSQFGHPFEGPLSNDIEAIR